ncbi:MAG: hypothetical protein IJN29_05970, partial [Akkermansia sp.]|nr:hypothetical protein [Akkermansia sp.]
PHHPVGFGLFFCAIPTGFVRVAHSTPWLLYAASPYGEAPEFRLPVGRLGKIRSPRGGERTQAGASEQRERCPC